MKVGLLYSAKLPRLIIDLSHKPWVISFLSRHHVLLQTNHRPEQEVEPRIDYLVITSDLCKSYERGTKRIPACTYREQDAAPGQGLFRGRSHHDLESGDVANGRGGIITGRLLRYSHNASKVRGCQGGAIATAPAHNFSEGIRTGRSGRRLCI